jgi:hypothetical protein
MKPIYIFLVSLVIFVSSSLFGYANYDESVDYKPSSCTPTKRYAMAESYRPDAPERAIIGDGSVLHHGRVLAWPNCLPVANAKVEFWAGGPNGFYDADHRATIYTNERGYWFLYGDAIGIPNVHVHFLVSAFGVRPVTSAYYPESARSGGYYDLVVIPAGSSGPENFFDTQLKTGEGSEATSPNASSQRSYADFIPKNFATKKQINPTLDIDQPGESK